MILTLVGIGVCKATDRAGCNRPESSGEAAPGERLPGPSGWRYGELRETFVWYDGVATIKRTVRQFGRAIPRADTRPASRMQRPP